MASLKEIMNVDDDYGEQDSLKRDRPPQGPRRTDAVDQSALSPTFASSRHTSLGPGYLHGTNRSPSYAQQALESERRRSSSSGTSTRGSRPPSNTSLDSMDPHYGYSPTGLSQQSGTASRSPMASVAEGESSVKRTPVTNKPSKAKKGMPVHRCDDCHPPKIYTRAEHLRRHRLSHGPPELVCPVAGCDKSFYRRDLLERHQSKHEQELPSSASQQGQTHILPTGSSQPFGHPAASSVASMPMAFGGSHQDPGSHLGSSTGMAGRGAPWDYSKAPLRDHGRGISNPENDAHQADFGYDAGRAGYQTAHASTGASGIISELAPSGLVVTSQQLYPHNLHGASYAWQDHSASSTPSNAFSTAPNHPSGQGYPIPASTPGWETNVTTHAGSSMVQSPTDTTSSNPNGTEFGYTTASQQSLRSSSYMNEDISLPLSDLAVGDTLGGARQLGMTTVRSMPPLLEFGQSSETLVTATLALQVDRIFTSHDAGRSSRQELDLLSVDHISSQSLDRSTLDFLSTCVEVYWDKVAPMHPFVHRATFETETQIPPEELQVLRCAMAAVASQYINNKEARVKGGELHAFACNKVCLLPHSEPWSLTTMQTIVLCEYYARFRGRQRASHMASPQFVSLYQILLTFHLASTPAESGYPSIQQYATWVEYETRRRLLAACFLLDMHTMIYFEQPAVPPVGVEYTAPETLRIPLMSSSQEQWAAQDGQHAAHCRPADKQEMELCRVLENIDDLAVSLLHPFDSLVILAGLMLPQVQEKMASIDSLQRTADVTVGKCRIARLIPESYLGNMYMALQHTPVQILLSVSGDSWVLNKKVAQLEAFTRHQQQLEVWQGSCSLAVAVAYACRSLQGLLRLDQVDLVDSDPDHIEVPQPSWADLSEYWAVYMCALICWAFGHRGKRRLDVSSVSVGAAARWISRTASLEPQQIQAMPGSQAALGVVTIARNVLQKDCLGGRSMLYADSVRVLKKLHEGDNWTW